MTEREEVKEDIEVNKTLLWFYNKQLQVKEKHLDCLISTNFKNYIFVMFISLPIKNTFHN